MQCYKDRDPKWIKVYRELLDDYNFGSLSDATKFHVIGLRLLAAKLDNKIPKDEEWVRYRIGAKDPISFKDIENAGFIEPYDGSENCVQIRTDSYRETEKNKSKKRKEAYTEESDEIILSRLLFDLQKKNFNLRKPNFQNWADEMRKLLHTDGMSVSDIRGMIEWVVTDLHEPNGNNWRGWAPNIKSTKKLRDKWDDLCAAKAKAPKPEKQLSQFVLDAIERECSG